MNKWVILSVIALIIILLIINRKKIAGLFSSKPGSNSNQSGGGRNGSDNQIDGVGTGTASLDLPDLSDSENLRMVRQSNLQRIIQSA